MEYLILALALSGFVIVVVTMEAYRAEKEQKQFIHDLYHNYQKLGKKNYSSDRFEKLNSYYLKHSSEGQLDDITWNDLGMDEIFMRINYTLSASGEEYLYYQLRTPSLSLEEMQHFEALLQYFDTHPDQRVRFQYCMKKLGYTGKYSLYDYIDNLDYLGERSNIKHWIADALFLLCIPMLWVNFTFGILGLVIIMLYNIISYFKDKSEIEPYITSFAYILRLMENCEKIQKLGMDGCEKEITEIREHLKGLKAISRNSFWVMFDSKTSMSSGDILSGIIDYIKMIFHIDIIKFNQMLKHLRGHMDDVDALISKVGYLETVIAVWIFRQTLDNGWCVPELAEDDIGCRLEVQEGYHPLLASPVKNSIATDKGILLTGSNASGKSTFLKMIAINAVLSQSIHTCTAGKYKAPFYHIYTSMALRDDISGGESYYIVEIKALKRILDYAETNGGKVLCFVDEVLRGTNTVERIAASTQILKTLGNKGILCFAATHDIELTELLKDRFYNYHFEEDIVDGDIRFNYILQVGKATTRNAIKLLQLLGYEDSIIECAAKQAAEFMNSGEWKS